MEELVKQVQLLIQTIQAQTQRLDQGFKRHDELLILTQDLATKLQTTLDSFQVVVRALEKSLEELGQNVDDQAKITAALLQIQQEAEQSA